MLLTRKSNFFFFILRHVNGKITHSKVIENETVSQSLQHHIFDIIFIAFIPIALLILALSNLAFTLLKILFLFLVVISIWA